MTIPDIQAVIRRALDTDGILTVKNYMSSGGSLRDYVVDLTPELDYIGMVKGSLKLLLDPTLQQVIDAMPMRNRNGDELTADNKQAAIRQLVESFTRTIDGTNTGYVIPSASLIEVDGLFYYEHEVNPGAADVFKDKKVTTVILKHFEVLDTVRHNPLDVVTIPKGAIPAAKWHIKSLLPMAKFGGQMNLTTASILSISASR